MGIPQLTRHLLPYSEAVYLGDTDHTTEDKTRYLRKVVIDGPSLVHHVFHRMLSWRDANLNPVDAQPTPNEVSKGVLLYLLFLRQKNVQV